jgi:hypothetical protein
MIEPGQQFGRLTVLHVSNRRDPNGSRRCSTCVCTCGKKKVVRNQSLRRGSSQSCGCLVREHAARFRTHGATDTPEYQAWRNMLSRCYNPNWPKFSDYGGRGIRVCLRWRSRGFLCRGFRAFIQDMGKRPTRFHSLERSNVNLGYSPTNCKWATAKQQANNKRTSVRNRQKQSTEELIEQGLDY